MVYVRRVIGAVLIALGVMSLLLLVEHWNQVDKHGNRVLFGYLSMFIAFAGSGVAIVWPVKESLRAGPRKARVAVYARRIFALVFIAGALTFALRIPGNAGRKTKKGGSAVTSDVLMVVLFTGLTTAVLFPTRREKSAVDAATS